MKIRSFAGGALLLVGTLLASACSAPAPHALPEAPAQPPALPASPVTLNILDVSGDLAHMKPVIENYKAAHPKLVSGITYETGSPADVAGKLAAQQAAGRVSIDIVLTGIEGLSNMRSRNTLLRLLPNYQPAFPDLASQLTASGSVLHEAGGGYGILDSADPNGPLLTYSASRVGTPPTTPEALLAWAKKHPGRFGYPTPTGGSGPANQFIDALPHMLGDSDPGDPATWSKTWAYLAELNKYTGKYFAKTVEAFDALTKGAIDLTVTSGGWDQQQHANGTLGEDIQVVAFDDPKLVIEGRFVTVPRGIEPGTLAVVLDLAKWMLKPDQQALTYALHGSGFPVKGVEPSLAPPGIAATFQKFGRPELVKKLQDEGTPVAPLAGAQVQAMFAAWNQKIGSQK
ncbi:ABC transporter substrate-binding protein [Sphaerisporangium melleum]|uniref:ABC transporter substrate-binding protein n=1 Tax=Sphaerisporangium melleum TaxID=321316 RepID=A0A917VVB7_9ACTN|nr:extracellular solute-binding protein [Sphaerisporangium melleum]GGL17645.1 ABC transporter substrate-binding protein [Sphaerisporangium melleum]GII74838.1 ABC transporter substrate-binding protein [Sphaerisporangium melleum]